MKKDPANPSPADWERMQDMRPAQTTPAKAAPPAPKKR